LREIEGDNLNPVLDVAVKLTREQIQAKLSADLDIQKVKYYNPPQVFMVCFYLEGCQPPGN